MIADIMANALATGKLEKCYVTERSPRPHAVRGKKGGD